ncbi:MAG: GspE/PulE family protein [Paracoccaceae bacterium]
MLTYPDSTTTPIARLAETLLEDGRLDHAALRRAERVAEETDERLDTVLTRLGLVDERSMADAFARVLGCPRAGPADFPAEPLFLEDLGARFLLAARLLPLADGAEGAILAVADPVDRAAVDAVRLKLGRPVEIRIGLPSEIEAALERLYAGESDAAAADTLHETDTAADIAKLRDLASEAPVIRIVNQIIRKAAEARASDIHLEPFEQSLRVRLRVDGALREVPPPPGPLRAAVISRIKIMAKLNIAEQRLPQDGRIQATVAGRALDMRIATLPTLHGEGVVMRLLDRSGLVLDYDGLGFDAAVQEALLPLIERPNGILLVTGPTGSGKTTTLYATLSRLNRPDRKVITVEDPVEYHLDGITQIQVKPQIGLSFAHGLRAILRQDPDIIMIGEIRDRETAEIAVQAALTGHLVLATLHTNSAAAAIARLRDMGVEDYLLTATLVGTVAQRLVRRLCPDCAAPESAPLVEGVAPGRDPAGFRKAIGCAACQGTGYRGRTGVMEVLEIDDPIRRAILSREDQRDIEALAVARGMRTMRAHGIEKAARGETALGEVLRLAAEV